MIWTKAVIVSRHVAAIQFIAECLGSEGIEYVFVPREPADPADVRPLSCLGDVLGYVRPDVDDAFWKPGTCVDRVNVLSSAAANDVRDRYIYGNVPLHLAAVAASVYAIEFSSPPRGTEYTLADMHKAGAKLVQYRVTTVEPSCRRASVANSYAEMDERRRRADEDVPSLRGSVSGKPADC
jgi:hypothetical protein